MTLYTTALVDGHVHLHACHQAARFFNAATENLAEAGRQLGLPAALPSYLLLTECAPDRAFESLAAIATGHRSAAALELGSWQVSRTMEDVSLRLKGPKGDLYVIAGRQVACREGLEILLPGTLAEFEDGRSIHEVLKEASALGLARVVPWGAGKWFFSRGRLLSQLVREHKQALMFLGDEGGRPWFWPYPRHFVEAAGQGVRDLPGTDPLPFPHDFDKVGRMGVAVNVEFDPDRPWQSLFAALADPATRMQRFASLEGSLRFVRNQAGMQLRKRRAT